MQTARTDCGIACALTILAQMGRTGDAVEAMDLMDPDRAGASLESLRLYFQDHHFAQARALAVPADQIGRVRGHVILHMQQQHYVVLLRQNRDGILVFDPAVGVVYYPTRDFRSLYSGHLLEVNAPRGRAQSESALTTQVVGGTSGRSFAPLGLFVTGLASRFLECAILLCLVAALFLVLNHASFSSLLAVFGILVLCGAVLLVARQSRFEGEDNLTKSCQSRLWRGILRNAFRGRDLSGFRGRFERDVSGNLRKGMMMGVPQMAQVPASLGAFAGLSALLFALHPGIALLHVMLFAALLVFMQLDDIQVCRVSVRKGVGRYSKLSQSTYVPNATTFPETMGETAKWSVIGFAGFSVLLADLPPVALMFWILTAMQIVPLDFRRAKVLMPMFTASPAVSGMMGADVPMRTQRILSDVSVKVSGKDNILRIEGIKPLTETLQQPDLTVREQRVIMADIVQLAVGNMPEESRPNLGPIRIFGPGQDATQSDFEHLLIAQDPKDGTTLPAPIETRRLIEQGSKDAVLRDLHSCAPGDFPVFWDFRNKMGIEELQARLKDSGVAQAAHLTMNRLTLVKAA
ncbi:MAG: cysteine peptidase family C39 domain-containing protein [Arenibacterium sp.]